MVDFITEFRHLPVGTASGSYRLESFRGDGSIHPYTTVRYNIGTGTDPRVYDEYDYPQYGQTAEERAFVEASVGYGLTNGLYELTATVSERPIVPVVITVGDGQIVMTNAGECVFLCEKGLGYSLSVSPSFSPAVVFSARDDIAPIEMVGALRSSGWSGAQWTVDNRLVLEQPLGGLPGFCLWLPTFTAGPDVPGHWYPSDGDLHFSAYLSDYSRTNPVYYAWSSTASEDVTIGSPSAQSTSVSLTGNPGWGSVDLTVTATVEGRELVSTLEDVTYGTNDHPGVSFSLDVPSAVLLNSNEVSNAKLRRFEIRFSSDVEPTGIIQLDFNSENDSIRLWSHSNRTGRVNHNKVWSASEFNGFVGYIEGVRASSEVNDTYVEVCYRSDHDEDVIQRQNLTVVEIGDIVVAGDSASGIVVMTNAHVSLSVECRPVNSGYLVNTEWGVRALRQDGTYEDWRVEKYMSGGNTWNCYPPCGGIYQIFAEVEAGVTSSGKRYYRWSADENQLVGDRKCGALKSIGVVNEQWQISLRDNALTYLGRVGYGYADVLPSCYQFAALDDNVWKCNMFVAHRIRQTVGLSLEHKHLTMAVPPFLPPLANEWAGDVEISNWIHPAPGEFVQPGWIIAHPNPNPGRSGHVGIVDFDGIGVAAGSRVVNRLYPLWLDGTSKYRRYIDED